MAKAVLLVPPPLKIAHGPLLGPAMLIGAARVAGHDVQLHDLNATWIHQKLPSTAPWRRDFVGDHDRPSALGDLHRDCVEALSNFGPRETHESIFQAAAALARGAHGAWVLVTSFGGRLIALTSSGSA